MESVHPRRLGQELTRWLRTESEAGQPALVIECHSSQRKTSLYQCAMIDTVLDTTSDWNAGIAVPSENDDDQPAHWTTILWLCATDTAVRYRYHEALCRLTHHGDDDDGHGELLADNERRQITRRGVTGRVTRYQFLAVTSNGVFQTHIAYEHDASSDEPVRSNVDLLVYDTSLNVALTMPGGPLPVVCTPGKKGVRSIWLVNCACGGNSDDDWRGWTHDQLMNYNSNTTIIRI